MLKCNPALLNKISIAIFELNSFITMAYGKKMKTFKTNQEFVSKEETYQC